MCWLSSSPAQSTGQALANGHITNPRPVIRPWVPYALYRSLRIVGGPAAKCLPQVPGMPLNRGGSAVLKIPILRDRDYSWRARGVVCIDQRRPGERELAASEPSWPADSRRQRVGLDVQRHAASDHRILSSKHRVRGGAKNRSCQQRKPSRKSPKGTPRGWILKCEPPRFRRIAGSLAAPIMRIEQGDPRWQRSCDRCGTIRSQKGHRHGYE